MLTCQYIKLSAEESPLPNFFSLTSYVTGSLKVNCFSDSFILRRLLLLLLLYGCEEAEPPIATWLKATWVIKLLRVQIT